MREVPKPLLEVAGKPFLRHQLELLRSHGARRIVLSVGYLGEQIEEALGDGAGLGLEIAYVYDGPEPAGTAGALRAALPLLGDPFLVLYGDTYLRIDYGEVERALGRSGAPALMTVLRNEGRWDTSNVIYADGRVLRYDKREPTAEMHWIDYGLGALRAEAFDLVPPDTRDLADFYRRLACEGKLAGFEANERFYEIGAPESLRETEEFLRGLS